MICKIFYRKVTGDVEKMRISKKEEKKCKICQKYTTDAAYDSVDEKITEVAGS